MTATLDTINLDATISTGSGLSADITTVISYPQDYGLFVIRLLEGLPDYADSVINELFGKNDASVVKGAEAAASPADAERGDIGITATLTTEDDVIIPMSVNIGYPVGYGSLILPVLNNMATEGSRNEVLRMLINKGDGSLISAAMKMS